MNAGVETKFVVLTTNRSGSVWLMSTLNSHPSVTAQGELFLPRKRSLERRWDSEFACPRFTETRFERLSFRPFSVFAYLSGFYRTPGIVGFKLMYAQLRLYPEILYYLMRHHIRVIHLVRRNHLDILLSFAVKKELGRAHILVGQSVPKNIRVDLETDNLLGRLEWLEKKQRVARKLLQMSRLPHIEVAYEDLLRDQAPFRSIADFLSISQVASLNSSNIVKIRAQGHRDVLSNYSQVREVLADSKFAELLE